MSAINNNAISINRTAVEVNPVAVPSVASSTGSLLQSASATQASGQTNADDPQRESVRVSSSIGRAATAGQLSRQEALEIYRQIASLL